MLQSGSRWSGRACLVLWLLSAVAGAQPDPLREQAVQVAYRLDYELGPVDSAQRHLQVARLLLALEQGELSPSSALDEVWYEWESRIEALEGGLRGDLPIWYGPHPPDAIDAMVGSVRSDQVALTWTEDLWMRDLVPAGLRAVSGAAADQVAAPAYYPWMLAWARSHAPEIWYRFLTMLDGAPESRPIIAPLIQPWMALPLEATLEQWRALDDRASDEIAAILRADGYDPLAVIRSEIDLLYDESLLVERYRQPVLVALTYLRFLHAPDDAGARALTALARGIHRLDRGGYAELVGALVSLGIQRTLADDDATNDELLTALERLDPFLLPFLNRVDPRLINVYQQTRRLLRQWPEGPTERQRRLRTLAELDSALGLDIAALDRYVAQPFRQPLTQELLVCFGLSPQGDPRPPPPITAEQYRGCMASLAGWTMEQARSPELSGQPGGPYEVANLYRESRLNPAQRINYWLGYMQSVLGSECPLPDSALVNPMEWSIAARSLRWFLDRWLPYSDQVSIDTVQRVQAMGRRSLAAMARMRSCMEPVSPLLGVIGRYRATLDTLGEALTEATARFRAERLSPGADVDLAGDASQATQYRPVDVSVGPCEQQPQCGMTQTFEASNALYSLFPKPYLVADQIGLGQVSLCYAQVSWVDRRAVVPPVRNQAMASYHGHLSFTLKGQFSGMDEPVFAMRLVSPDEYEYLFGANSPEVLADECPRERVNTQVTASLPERELELVPRRLTFMTAERAQPARVFQAHWANGQQWRDRFVTGQGIEVLSRQGPEPVIAAVDERLKALNREWNQTIYHNMLAGELLLNGRAAGLSEAMHNLEAYKQVVSALAKLLAPRSLELDPALRATLYGEAGLFDRGAVLRLQQRAVPVDQLLPIAESRFNDAMLEWDRAVSEIAPRPLAEAEPLVVATLLQLEALMSRMQSTPAPSVSAVDDQ